MTTARRNVMWPLIVVAVGSIWLLMVAGALPAAVGDVLQRGWPALLVLFGLDVLAGQRRLFVAGRTIRVGYLALAAVLILLAGVIGFAYREQADVLRSDTRAVLDEQIPDEVERVQVVVDLKRTSVTVNPSGEANHMSAQFEGSRESDVALDWELGGSLARLAITETYRHSIPKLEDLGRGTLTITVPTNVTVERLSLANEQGDVVLNLRPVPVENLEVAVDGGSLTLDLPDQRALLGDLRVTDGGLSVNVPLAVALTLNRGSNSGTPTYSYDTDRYDLLANGELKRQNTVEFNVGLTVTMKGGAPLVVSDVE